MTVKMVMAAVAALVLVSLPNQSDAKPRHSQLEARQCVFDNSGRTVCADAVKAFARASAVDANGNQVVSHPAGCPRRLFCGCGASVKVFGRPIPRLFLAANWLSFPRANPAPGMVAARRGHVFVILAYNGDGTALVWDANSGGHKTRIHVRSLAGYKVVNPYGRLAVLR